MLARTGDDLNRTVKKVNVTLDTVNGETLPRVNATIDATQQVVVKVGDGADRTLSEVSAMVSRINSLLADDTIRTMLNNAATTSDEVARLAAEIRQSGERIDEALPELLRLLQGVAANSDQATREVAVLLGQFNRPLTKKQKVLKYLLQALALGAPIAVQHLR